MGNSLWPRSTRIANLTAAGRPSSSSASIAARAVLPVYRTSSTRTTVLPVTSNGTLLPRTSGSSFSRSSRWSVIQGADGHIQTLELADVGRDPPCQGDPAGEHSDEGELTQAGGVALEDFVGDTP